MKDVEAKLREAWENSQQYLERINTLPLAERITTIFGIEEIIRGS
jgi:hypothetical protein